MKLRAADVSDLPTVLRWVTTEWEQRVWAGPQVRYPATPDSAWSDMEATGDNTYALVDSKAALIGFGQVLPRDDNMIHLARLIVDPDLRGQGLGRDLCVALINMGASTYQAKSVSLNVYESNAAALRLYESLGFKVKEQTSSGAVTMVRLTPGGFMRCGN